jgi:selenide,water dikinase
MRPVPGVRLTLVSPEATAPYTGMLPGHVAGHYPREALDIDLVRLARFAGARFIPARVVGLDPEAREARLSSGRRVPYDIASLDIGITSHMDGLPGFAEHGVPAKPLGPFAERWADAVAGTGRLRLASSGAALPGRRSPWPARTGCGRPGGRPRSRLSTGGGCWPRSRHRRGRG